MHEMSLALETCRLAEQHVGRGQLMNVVELGIEVGEEAGVEIENLAFCLEALLATPPFAGAQLVVTRLPGDDLRLSYLEVDDGDPDD